MVSLVQMTLDSNLKRYHAFQEAFNGQNIVHVYFGIKKKNKAFVLLTAVSGLLAQDMSMVRHLPMDTYILSLDHSSNQPSPGQVFPY